MTGIISLIEQTCLLSSEDGLRLGNNRLIFIDYTYYSDMNHDFELTLNRSNDTEPYGIN